MAELESKDKNVELITEQIAVSKKLFDINNLGGTIKVGEIIANNVSSINELQKEIINHCKDIEIETKFNYGISYYGNSKINFNQIGIKLKKELKSTGLKPRFVMPSDGAILNAASIKHNKIFPDGREFIVVQSKDKMLLAVGLSFQDIDMYSKRDYEKPCRDRKVGMLPPKLSQIMINLANPDDNTVICDPFCGSGGLLMEASLMGYDSIGSDLSDDMTKCAKKNIEWFLDNFNAKGKVEILKSNDATKLKYPKESYSVVTEGFLGINFLSKPTKQLIDEQISNLKNIYVEFFKNLLLQERLPDVVCICVPFWRVNEQTIRLNLIDEIANLGYTIVEFKSARQSTLNYYREGQFTGRQIVVFKPNKEN
ncbi:hypothetical protein LBMAG34_1480 [Candidatus Saccharibacteria bacterium]|nr:hypothetical protein LBMAG34_1480 [Candidatus Saccharibacteria bacterium]